MKEKVVLFGAGYRYRALKQYIDDFEVVAIVDNNPDLHGSVTDGLIIAPPSAIHEMLFDKIIITPVIKTEILKQLYEMSVPTDKVYPSVIQDFDELDRYIEGYKQGKFNGIPVNERFFLDYCWVVDRFSFLEKFGKPTPADPFSYEYHKWVFDLYEFISGRKYSDMDFEGIRITTDPVHKVFDIAENTSSVAFEFVDKVLPNESKVLEMGCGEGGLSVAIAKRGHSAYGIDASEEAINLTKSRISKVKNSKANVANFAHGSFFDVANFSECFDVVVFDAAFHHCGDPVRMLEFLNDKTTIEGRVVFFRDGIMPVDFDYPWCLNLYSAESILQIRMRGWLELYFREDFFCELLDRTGWLLSDIQVLSDGSKYYEVKKRNS